MQNCNHIRIHEVAALAMLPANQVQNQDICCVCQLKVSRFKQTKKRGQYFQYEIILPQ